MTHTPLKLPTDLETDKELKARYPVLVGKLLWVSNTVQPDISFAVNTLAYCHRASTEIISRRSVQLPK